MVSDQVGGSGKQIKTELDRTGCENPCILTRKQFVMLKTALNVLFIRHLNGKMTITTSWSTQLSKLMTGGATNSHPLRRTHSG